MKNSSLQQGPIIRLLTRSGPQECIKNEVIMKVRGDVFTPGSETGEIIETFSLSRSPSSGGSELVRIKLDDDADLAGSLTRLSERPGVEYAVPNHVIRLNDESTKPVTLSQTQESEPDDLHQDLCCLLYTSPSPRDLSTSRMPSSA